MYSNLLISNNDELQSILELVDQLPDRAQYQNKSVTPSGAEVVITYDGGYDCLGAVTVVGDSDLNAVNIKQGVSIFGVYGTYINPSGGVLSSHSNAEDEIISRSLGPVYVNDRITEIQDEAFCYCQQLKSVRFPACTKIAKSAFRSCWHLVGVDIPLCVSVSADAFDGCHQLSSVSFPQCRYIGHWAFAYAYNLTSVSLPACTECGQYAFHNCSALSVIDLPLCNSMPLGIFDACASLKTVSLPDCVFIGEAAFNYCKALTSISLPKVQWLSSRAFDGCYQLSQIYLTASSVCSLYGSNVFSYTPYVGFSTYCRDTPYIYVPSSLVASYQTATNWTYFSSYIKGV